MWLTLIYKPCSYLFNLSNLLILHTYWYLWQICKYAVPVSKKELGLCGAWFVDTAFIIFKFCCIIQTDITLFSGLLPIQWYKDLAISAPSGKSLLWSSLLIWAETSSGLPHGLEFPPDKSHFFHRCYSPISLLHFKLILASVYWKTQCATIDVRSGPRETDLELVHSPPPPPHP